MQAKDQKRKGGGGQKRKINHKVCTQAEILNKCTDTRFRTLGVH